MILLLTMYNKKIVLKIVKEFYLVPEQTQTTHAFFKYPPRYKQRCTGNPKPNMIKIANNFSLSLRLCETVHFRSKFVL